MKFSYILWLLGVVIAVVVGLSVFDVYQVPVLIDQLKNLVGADWAAKSLFVALALLALSKLLP
jgi:hypothetical protein